jgi:hypothetical protein
MSPLRLWRQWRLNRWRGILYAREQRLEAFEKSPFDKHFSTAQAVKNTMRNEVSKARYKVDLLIGYLPPMLPAARIERSDQ